MKLEPKPNATCLSSSAITRLLPSWSASPSQAAPHKPAGLSTTVSRTRPETVLDILTVAGYTAIKKVAVV